MVFITYKSKMCHKMIQELGGGKWEYIVKILSYTQNGMILLEGHNSDIYYKS